MRKDCLYARVSTLDQSSEIMQLAACRRVSERDGALVVAQLQDKESGLVETRDGYQEALRLLRTGQADRLVIWRLDRFGRDQAEVAARIKELGHLGVQLISATEGPLDEFLGALLGVLAQRESRNTSIRVHARLLDIVTREKRCMSRPPYGYRVCPGRRGYWQVVEEEAALVRRLFDLYASGEWTMRGLTVWLNQQPGTDDRPLVTRRTAVQGGVPFRTDWVADVLAREEYAGVLIWNEQRRSKLDGIRGSVTRPQADHVRIPYPTDPVEQAGWPIPPIIDADTYRIVQDVREQHRQHRTLRAPTAPQRARFLLSSFLHCGACLDAGRNGTAMLGDWVNVRHRALGGKPPSAHVYFCPRATVDGTCTIKQRSGRQIDAAALSLLARIRFASNDPDDMNRKARIISAARAAHRQTDSGRARLQAARTQLTRTESRQRQLALDRLDGVFSVPEYQRLAASLAQEAAALQEEIAALGEHSDRALEVAARHAGQLGEIVFTLPRLGLAQRRGLLAECVQRVILRSRYPLIVEVVWQSWLLTLQEARLATLPPTVYEAPPRPPAMTPLERARRYRQRKKDARAVTSTPL